MREQLEVQKEKAKTMINDDASDAMSFIGAGVGSPQIRQLETRIQDLEREKEFLQTKIASLEKSNKDLHAY